MYALQVSTLIGEQWSTIATAGSLAEIEHKRGGATMFPMTFAQIVRKCEHCDEEVELGLLAEFENPNRCPNCHMSWEK